MTSIRLLGPAVHAALDLAPLDFADGTQRFLKTSQMDRSKMALLKSPIGIQSKTSIKINRGSQESKIMMVGKGGIATGIVMNTMAKYGDDLKEGESKPAINLFDLREGESQKAKADHVYVHAGVSRLKDPVTGNEKLVGVVANAFHAPEKTLEMHRAIVNPKARDLIFSVTENAYKNNTINPEFICDVMSMRKEAQERDGVARPTIVHFFENSATVRDDVKAQCKEIAAKRGGGLSDYMKASSYFPPIAIDCISTSLEDQKPVGGQSIPSFEAEEQPEVYIGFKANKPMPFEGFDKDALQKLGINIKPHDTIGGERIKKAGIVNVLHQLVCQGAIRLSPGSVPGKEGAPATVADAVSIPSVFELSHRLMDHGILPGLIEVPSGKPSKRTMLKTPIEALKLREDKTFGRFAAGGDPIHRPPRDGWNKIISKNMAWPIQQAMASNDESRWVHVISIMALHAYFLNGVRDDGSAFTATESSLKPDEKTGFASGAIKLTDMPGARTLLELGGQDIEAKTKKINDYFETISGLVQKKDNYQSLNAYLNGFAPMDVAALKVPKQIDRTVKSE